MKKSLFLALSLPFAAGLALAACDDADDKDVCEQAADVVSGCDLPEGEDTGDDGGDPPECAGDVEAASQCVVDYPDQACAFYEDLVDLMQDNPDDYAEFADCIGV